MRCQYADSRLAKDKLVPSNTTFHSLRHVYSSQRFLHINTSNCHIFEKIVKLENVWESPAATVHFMTGRQSIEGLRVPVSASSKKPKSRKTSRAEWITIRLAHTVRYDLWVTDETSCLDKTKNPQSHQYLYSVIGKILNLCFRTKETFKLFRRRNCSDQWATCQLYLKNSLTSSSPIVCLCGMKNIALQVLVRK